MLKLRFKDNKYNAVWLVEPKVTIGRLSSNDLVVDEPGVANHQLEILVDHERLTLINSAPEQPVKVNGELLTEPRPLHINDIILLGQRELVVVDPKSDAKATASPAAPAGSAWALKANHSSLANRVFPIKESTIVGRSSDCDISLGAAHLSRRHAQLQVLEGLLYVKDLGSANGTYLNGKKITEARVKRGDELRFDALSFGVIGPADDMDKTTVRTRGAPIAGTNAGGRAAPAANKPRPVAVRSSTPSKPAAPEVVHARHSAATAAPASGQGKSWWWMVAIVMLVVIAAVLGMTFL